MADVALRVGTHDIGRAGLWHQRTNQATEPIMVDALLSRFRRRIGFMLLLRVVKGK